MGRPGYRGRVGLLTLATLLALALGACATPTAGVPPNGVSPQAYAPELASDTPPSPIPVAGAPSPSATATPAAMGGRLAAPASGMYLAANPDFGGEEDEVSAERITAFEQLSGRGIAWAYFSDNWDNGIVFPAGAVQAARAVGTVPFIRLMPRSSFDEGGPDPVYTMQGIANGQFDAELRQWAREARTAGPLLLEFGTEVNGDWFPWNGRYNGGANTGPQRFRDAYRHIADLFRAEGATNITWFFHVDASGSPEARWNAMANYYPGDDYVDWLGISAYGAQTPDDDWDSFADVMDDGYAELAKVAPSKPIALLEFGVTDGYKGGDKAAWIRDAFAAITSGRYPRLKAVSWWNETFENDDGSTSALRIDSSQKALDAYRQAVANPAFVTTAQFR